MAETSATRTSRESRGWRITTLIVACLSLLVAIGAPFVSYSFRPKRTFDVELVHQEMLSAIGESTPEKITLLYGDTKISNVSVIVLRVANRGNKSIRPEDFIRSVTFVVPKKCRVVAATVGSERPLGLKVEVRVESAQRVALLPTLLNAGDSFNVSLLVLDVPQTGGIPVRIEGRVADVNRLAVSSGNDEHGFFEQLGTAYGTDVLFIIPGIALGLLLLLTLWSKPWYFIERIFGERPRSRWPRLSLDLAIATLVAVTLEDVVEGCVAVWNALATNW